MQSSAFVTRKENQKLISKHITTKNQQNYEHERALLVCRIQISSACNQQPASIRATIRGSVMQCSALATGTENQKLISKQNTTQNQEQKLKYKAAAEECSLTRHARSRNLHELSNNSARQRRHRLQPRQQRHVCLRCGRRQHPAAAPPLSRQSHSSHAQRRDSSK